MNEQTNERIKKDYSLMSFTMLIANLYLLLIYY